jgi:hypothetical protein
VLAADRSTSTVTLLALYSTDCAEVAKATVVLGICRFSSDSSCGRKDANIGWRAPGACTRPRKCERNRRHQEWVRSRRVNQKS